MVARTYEVYLRVEKKQFTSGRSKQVKFFFLEKINFICSNQHVIFFLLRRYECFENKKDYVSGIFTCEDMENISLVSRM